MEFFDEKDRENIYVILSNRPHLTPVFTSTLCIPEQIKEYDDSLFVVFNNKRKYFELHSQESFFIGLRGWTTYQMVLSESLDETALELIYANDMKKHGKRILLEIDEFNDRMEEGQEKMSMLQMKKHTKDFVKYISGTYDVY